MCRGGSGAAEVKCKSNVSVMTYAGVHAKGVELACRCASRHVLILSSMAGIQVSGLLANQAFDWKSVVDQLIEVEKIPVKKLEAEKEGNTDKMEALGEVTTALQALQDSLQSIRANNVFSARAVTSDDTATTWKSSSALGAPVGDYKFAVSQLATPSRFEGGLNIGSSLAATNDVSGVTLATMRTSPAVTAGYFSVNGQRVTIALTDSLQDVFDKISTATGGTVTAAYDAGTDRITITDTNPDPTAKLVLGASNDTSNFLVSAKLGSPASGLVAQSTVALGTVARTGVLNSAGLATPIAGLDVDGKGSFTVNGVAISYDPAVDSFGSILSKINNAGAGVTASYDANLDQVRILNKSTGEVGISIQDVTGNLAAALGLSTSTGGSLIVGDNAEFTVGDGGPTLISRSNTLDESVHGIAGLSVTVNSETTQTLTVQSDTDTMQVSIEDFIDKFNAVQELIDEKTKITVAAGSVSASVLSGNREIQAWAQNLRRMAFDAVSGLTGSVDRLDDLGIDFDGTTSRLVIKNQGKLTTALSDKPEDVQAFFVSGSSGMVPAMYGTLTTLITASRSQRDTISKSSLKIDEQIATLQTRIENQREMLTNAFIRMLEAQSIAQQQNQSLTNSFFRDNKN